MIEIHGETDWGGGVEIGKKNQRNEREGGAQIERDNLVEIHGGGGGEGDREREWELER